MLRTGIIAKKVGMTRLFLEDGRQDDDFRVFLEKLVVDVVAKVIADRLVAQAVGDHELPVERLDLARVGQLEFRAPDEARYPALALARAALQDGSLWLLSSSEAVANLRGWLPEADFSRARALASHPRITEAARAAGFGHVDGCRPPLEDVVRSIKSRP